MRLLLDVVCIFPHFTYSTFFAITQSAEKPYPACVFGTFLTRSPSIIYTSAPPLRPTANCHAMIMPPSRFITDYKRQQARFQALRAESKATDYYIIYYYNKPRTKDLNRITSNNITYSQ